MKKSIDYNTIEKNIREILIALGDNPEREGIKETPGRVARMFGEVFEGMLYTNEEIASMFSKSFEDGFSVNNNNDIVIVRDIEVFSFCEHHLALMYDMKVTVAYIPDGKILGLSKIARISDMAAKRLQLQERIGNDIAEIMALASGSRDIAVFIEANHSCMTMRGIRKPSAKTMTSCLRGRFNDDESFQNRLFMLLKQN